MPEFRVGEVGKVVVSGLLCTAAGYAVGLQRHSSGRKVGPSPSTPAIAMCYSPQIADNRMSITLLQS